MERNDRYKKYQEMVHLSQSMKLLYDDGDLRIQGISQEDKLVVDVHFTDILLTRITPEGMRLKLLKDLGEVRSLVLIDERSDLISWIDDEGFNTRDLRHATHFVVLLGEEFVDVVSLSKPHIRIYEIGSNVSKGLE